MTECVVDTLHYPGAASS